MAIDKFLGDKISDHIVANSPQESIGGSGSITAYEVVNSCFDSIILLRRKEKDWAVVATQVMSSFEAVTGRNISISPSTLERYYYRVKASSRGKKKKKGKSKSDVTKSPPVVESAGVREAGEDKGQAEDVIPKDSAVAPGRGRKNPASGGDSGFQVPRRPGIRPPIHWDG